MVHGVATSNPWSIAPSQTVSLRLPGPKPSMLATVRKGSIWPPSAPGLHRVPVEAGGLGLFQPTGQRLTTLPVDALGALSLPTTTGGLLALGAGAYFVWRYFLQDKKKARLAAMRRARARAKAREYAIKAEYA